MDEFEGGYIVLIFIVMWLTAWGTSNMDIWFAQQAVEFCEEQGKGLKSLDHSDFTCSDEGNYSVDVLKEK